METVQQQPQRRHCAFCLKELSAETVQLCSGCKRRAYCGKRCQTFDWSPRNIHRTTGWNGQGHKFWCKIEYGEEDLDWKVVAIPGKGLGVLAQKVFPKYSRIMVEACQLKMASEGDYKLRGHPAMADLMPVDGTMEEKFALNHLGCAADENEDGVLCVRAARINHDCNANAAHAYDKQFNAKIIYAERDIAVGDEICISYQPFADISKPAGVPHRMILSTKWGIQCPADCICLDETVIAEADQCKELDSCILSLAQSGQSALAMEKVQQLLEKMDALPIAALNKMRTLYDGFQIGITQINTLDKAKEYMRERASLESKIYHPMSETLKKSRNYAANPSSHYAYMRGRGADDCSIV